MDDNFNIVEFGKLGEIAFNSFLNNNLISNPVWQTINRHLYKFGYNTTFNKQSTYFEWMNTDDESFCPFDFIINGKASSDKYHKWSLIALNNQPIVLIDVKTTTKSKMEFYRSMSEDTKINEFMVASKSLNIPVVYLICVIFVAFEKPYKDASKKVMLQNSFSLSNTKDWIIKFIPLTELFTFETNRTNKNILYKIPPKNPPSLIRRNF